MAFFDDDWDLSSHYATGYTDERYFNYTKAFITEVVEAIGAPGDSIFQSWVKGPEGTADLRVTPINLPEDSSVYSHTRLILEGLEIIDAVD